MIAYLTTIGEKTTDLAAWSLKRNGFEVHTVSGNDTLASKLKLIYEEAIHIDQDFIRIDADIVVNNTCTPETINNVFNDPVNKDAWWVQAQTYDWYQQNIGYGGIQMIRREVISLLLENIDKFKDHERPETELTRCYGMYNPRRFESYDIVLGLHNYKNDMERVKSVKQRRGQLSNYDFELAERLEAL